MFRDKREAENAVNDVEGWLNNLAERLDGGRKWTSQEVILDLGPILKAYTTRTGSAGELKVIFLFYRNLELSLPTEAALSQIPLSHPKFSSMSFIHPARSQTSKVEQLNEDENETSEMTITQNAQTSRQVYLSSNADLAQGMSSNSKGWLDTDDITEF